MMESGPFRADGSGGLKLIEGGWEEYTTMVFGETTSMLRGNNRTNAQTVDQPAGTGYSYTSTDRYVHELTEACPKTCAQRYIYAHRRI